MLWLCTLNNLKACSLEDRVELSTHCGAFFYRECEMGKRQWVVSADMLQLSCGLLRLRLESDWS